MQREAYVKKMAPLDPINFIGKAKSVPMLLQFASHDQFIPKEKAEQFANSDMILRNFVGTMSDMRLNAQAASERDNLA